MSTTTQHEFHPDAERLNAFAEQALGERERGQVLQHLAACSRCRQVVTLASEAALDAESAAPVTVQAAKRAHRRASRFRLAWRLAWIPAAALAAIATLAVYVHVRHVEQLAEMQRSQAQQVAQTAPVAVHPPQEQPQAAPPAAPAHGTPEMHVTRSAPKTSPRREPEAVPAPEPSASLPTASQSVSVSPPESAEEQTAPAAVPMMRQPAIEAPAERIPTFALKSMPPPASTDQQKLAELQRQAERQQAERQKAEMETMHRHLFAAKETPSASPHGAEGGARESHSAQAMVSSQPVAQAAMEPHSALQAPRASFFNPDGSVKRIDLPSGLRVESMAAAVPRVLAIDSAGALFLSEDSGETWQPVIPQWTGRAVKVRRKIANIDMEAAPTAAPANASGGSGDTGAANAPAPVPEPASAPAQAPTPTKFFELLNDQNQVWLSTDGKNWIAK